MIHIKEFKMSSPVDTSKFYVEYSAAPDWDTLYPKMVLKGEEQPETNYGTKSLKVLAPASFSGRWPTVKYSFFVECPGPARPLQHSEYVQLMESIAPSIAIHNPWA